MVLNSLHYSSCWLVTVVVLSCLLVTAQSQSTPTTALHAGFVFDSADVTPLLCTDSTSNPTKSPIYGDFNGDGRTDYFCNAHAIGQEDEFSLATHSGVFNHIKNPKTEKWCDYAQGELLTGDFNGDGREDLLCRYRSGSKFEMSEFAGPAFTPPKQIVSEFNCITSSTTLFLIGDLDGDNTDDFVCADLSSGKFRFHYNHHSMYYNYEMEETICVGSTSRIFLCDANGDGKDDFICHDTVARKYKVWYAYHNGHHPGHYKAVELPYVFGGNGVAINMVTAGDIDGDGKCDISCLSTTANLVRPTEELILYNEGNNQYSHRSLSLTSPNLIPCIFGYLKYGDFNGDGMLDLACVEPNVPLKIFYSTLRL